MKNRIISTLLIVTFTLTLGLSAMTSKPVEVINVNEVETEKEETKVDYIEKAEELQKEVDKKKTEEKAKKAKEEAKKKAEAARKEKEEAEKKAQESSKKSLGMFKLTFYCPCSKCCGSSGGITASGTKAKAGRTIAAPSNFKFGTKVEINGNTYVVEDRGGAIKGNRIDIFCNSHQEALNLGVQYAEVYIIN